MLRHRLSTRSKERMWLQAASVSTIATSEMDPNRAPAPAGQPKSLPKDALEGLERMNLSFLRDLKSALRRNQGKIHRAAAKQIRAIDHEGSPLQCPLLGCRQGRTRSLSPNLWKSLFGLSKRTFVDDSTLCRCVNK